LGLCCGSIEAAERDSMKGRWPPLQLNNQVCFPTVGLYHDEPNEGMWAVISWRSWLFVLMILKNFAHTISTYFTSKVGGCKKILAKNSWCM
jgi:hypothetical protein